MDGVIYRFDSGRVTSAAMGSRDIFFVCHYPVFSWWIGWHLDRIQNWTIYINMRRFPCNPLGIPLLLVLIFYPIKKDSYEGFYHFLIFHIPHFLLTEDFLFYYVVCNHSCECLYGKKGIYIFKVTF